MVTSWLVVPFQLPAGEIDDRLEAYLATVSDDELVSVIVNLKEQVEMRDLDLRLKREKATRRDRHEQVIRSLREKASRTQPVFIEYLNSAKSKGEVAGFTRYWISNLIVTLATKSEILRLAGHPSVGVIEKNFEIETMEPVSRGNGSPAARGIGVTPGLKAIQADRVWHELGFTGAGRLVANLDTGVLGGHVALSSRWRGRDPGVHWSEAWFDAAHHTWEYPVDFDGHGTHVMGTITGLGEATGDTIGVAWGAKWIACNATDQGIGPVFDNDVIAAFEWFADPDGDPSTIDDVPDVVQNSWGINETFGGSPPYTDCDSRWWVAIDNCEASGVVVTWSAGNEGAWFQTLRSPADRATTPYNVFSVGAVDATNYTYPYPIADFSSRGPSGCGGPYEIKPEVCAPGVDVYSCVNTGGYEGGWSGTSMAGPHVAGVVALMREAHPDLTVEQIKEILMYTAHDFGEEGEENTYGRGFIDAYEAVVTVMNGVGVLRGRITDAASGEPIPADLELLATGRSITADPATGKYGFILPGDSTYTVRVTHYGHDPIEQMVYVVPDDTTSLDLSMNVSPTGLLAGMVIDSETGLPLSGATVEILDTPADPAGTGSLGFFNLGFIPSGMDYRVRAEVAGFGLNTEHHSIVPGETNLLAFPMESDFYDDMEGGLNGWTHSNVTPGYSDQWHQTEFRNHTVDGSTAWKCGGPGGNSYQNLLDAGLVTPEIEIEEGYNLYFWHLMAAELYGGSEAWDGGIVEISVDGGDWQLITPVDGGGTPCFSGFHMWEREEFLLSGFSGTARFRFRFASNLEGTWEGWYIDDVVVAPGSQTQPVSIMLLPTEETIEIGPGGGTFTYHIAFVNNTDQIQNFDWWIDVSHGPNVLFGPIHAGTETLQAHQVITRTDISQYVPERVPPMTYNFNGKVGTLPGQYETISSFQFTKTK
jgi:subtilisin family serine protease